MEEGGHRLSVEDSKDVVRARPDTLIVSTGYVSQLRLDPDLHDALEQKGIRLIAHAFGKAAEEYNRLSAFSRVVLAFHLTC